MRAHHSAYCILNRLSDDDLIDPSITVDENNVIKRGSPPAICRSRENNQKPNPELKVQQPNPNKKDSGSNAKRPCDNPGHTKYWCGGPEVVDPNVPGVFIVVLNCNTGRTLSLNLLHQKSQYLDSTS